MTDWLAFEGRIAPLSLGRATCTILRLPPTVAAAPPSAGRLARWESPAPRRRRGLPSRISTARTEATHHKRITRLIQDLP